MTRQLAVVRPLPPGDHRGAYLLSPSRWLPSARRQGLDEWLVQLQAGGARRSVRCRVGDPWTTWEGIERRVHWEPVGEQHDIVPVERLLPTFDGGLFLAGVDAAPSLALLGEVDVPLGRIGLAADALVLHRVAQHTANAFLRDVADALLAQSVPASSGADQRS